MLKPRGILPASASSAAASSAAICARRQHCSARWRRQRAGRRHHRLAAGAGRPARPAGDGVLVRVRLFRDHRPGVHVDSDSVPAAVLGVSRPSDVYVLDHAVPDDSGGRARQLCLRADRSRSAPGHRLAAAGDCCARAGGDGVAAAHRRSDGGLAVAWPEPVVSLFIVPLAFALGMLFSDWHATRRPSLGSDQRVDVGRQRRQRRHRLDSGGDGFDVARYSLNLFIAAALYALLSVPLRRLAAAR